MMGQKEWEVGKCVYSLVHRLMVSANKIKLN